MGQLHRRQHNPSAHHEHDQERGGHEAEHLLVARLCVRSQGSRSKALEQLTFPVALLLCLLDARAGIGGVEG